MFCINSFCNMYSVCICSWWWDVHICIYFVSTCSVVFVDFLIKSSFEKYISTGSFPENLMLAKVVAISKKDDKSKIKNYRPIS